VLKLLLKAHFLSIDDSWQNPLLEKYTLVILGDQFELGTDVIFRIIWSPKIFNILVTDYLEGSKFLSGELMALNQL
jgi:hypothetical protein